jgi:hypothetical protein
MCEFYDFGGRESQVYTKTCDCGKVHEVSTQEDIEPEYYTSVFIKCDCGRSVGFELPVN